MYVCCQSSGPRPLSYVYGAGRLHKSPLRLHKYCACKVQMVPDYETLSAANSAGVINGEAELSREVIKHHSKQQNHARPKPRLYPSNQARDTWTFALDTNAAWHAELTLQLSQSSCRIPKVASLLCFAECVQL